jgi:hypothetical protein
MGAVTTSCKRLTASEGAINEQSLLSGSVNTDYLGDRSVSPNVKGDGFRIFAGVVWSNNVGPGSVTLRLKLTSGGTTVTVGTVTFQTANLAGSLEAVFVAEVTFTSLNQMNQNGGGVCDRFLVQATGGTPPGAAFTSGQTGFSIDTSAVSVDLTGQVNLGTLYLKQAVIEILAAP